MASLELVIPARPRDLGGFQVRRVLPWVKRRMVGPFIFVDHMGPEARAPGEGFDVKPHPHIGLATVTYLYEGEIFHRDSIGSAQLIQPGDVNWMTAGRGIAHSERTPAEARRVGARMHGLQVWVALPDEREDDVPSFHHHPASSLPRLDLPGVARTLVAGAAEGARAPVAVSSPLFYLDAALEPEAELPLPHPDEHAERAAYVVSGGVTTDGETFGAGTLLVFVPGAVAALRATDGTARVMLLGGAPIGPRHIDWNFVSSAPEKIEAAKASWRARGFPVVVGDEEDFVPYPTTFR
jgi:redox-sensitive bicupin YhaK (pirin superfamily)